MVDAVLAGFANVHSHAFQRRLRGAVQRRDPTKADSFWTWRTQMYALANRLDVAAIEATARLCYAECLEAGYTAVGEFHYLHHDVDGTHIGIETALAHVRAAADAGIRLTLLWTVYARGGVDRPPDAAQKRFAVTSLDQVWRALDALSEATRHTPLASVGLALHSVRAVPAAWMAPLALEARSRGLPIHAHVSEQPREVADCRAHFGVTPVGLLASHGVLGPDFTAVHATWLADDDVAALAQSGSTVCLCPTTEGDLGDGVPDTAALYAAGVPLCIGSDSHAVIDPFAELRLAEYQARAATGTRCVLSDHDGAVAPVLAEIGHDHGYRALGLDPDVGPDRVWLFGGARALAGTGDPAASALLAGHPGLIDRVEVGGETVVLNGRHLVL